MDLGVFVYETNEMLEKMADVLMAAETEGVISEECLNEVFRIMHTVKGSSAMLSLDGMTEAAHLVEDLFFKIRENRHKNLQHDEICDVSICAVDYFKEQTAKVAAEKKVNALDPSLAQRIEGLIKNIGGEKDRKYSKQNGYNIKILFEEDAKMENIRAFSIAQRLNEFCGKLSHRPQELLEDGQSADFIKKSGFEINIETSLSKDEIEEIIRREVFVKHLKIRGNEHSPIKSAPQDEMGQGVQNLKNNFLNVHISKLDKLMDLVGEMVIFQNLSGQQGSGDDRLRKLTDELRDAVMALRMMPIAGTFHKMNRVVRDMCKNLGKEAELVLIGEDTEVDKVIADKIADPLMHIVRNAMDHGLEDTKERLEKGKNQKGIIMLEAKNMGGEVMIRISDDGRGLDSDAILKKAYQGQMISEDMLLTDQDIYNLILLPGFSTKKDVSEYSGRGVGMDVVCQNVRRMGGSIFIGSEAGRGMAITIKIPLTLAIINAMEVLAAETGFVFPSGSIDKIIKITSEDTILHEEGREMIMLGNICCPIIRLAELFGIEGGKRNLEEGILLCIRSNQKTICLFADEVLGEGRAVIKPLPSYLKHFPAERRGVAGCTVMDGGRICLVLDVARIIENAI